MSEKIVQLNEEVIKGQIKDLDGTHSAVYAYLVSFWHNKHLHSLDRVIKLSNK